MNDLLRTWLKPTAHDALRSVVLVQTALALIIAIHPLYTFTHPRELHAVAAALAARGLPLAVPLTWLTMGAQLLCSVALIARRAVAPASLGSIVLLLGGGVLLYAPRWYVAGGASEEGHPGVEFNVLLSVALLGVLWTHWRRQRVSPELAARRGLDIIRVGAALLLTAHPLHAFLTWDVDGMREWGQGMEQLGFPLGVPLVWTVISVQLACSICLVARRAVVFASLGHIVVLLNGIWISHFPHWFVVGPDENGIELPLSYLVCFGACLLAYWPRQASVPVTGPQLT